MLEEKTEEGIPEVIFAENKQLEEIKKIVQTTVKKSNSVLVSRIKENLTTKKS